MHLVSELSANFGAALGEQPVVCCTLQEQAGAWRIAALEFSPAGLKILRAVRLERQLEQVVSWKQGPMRWPPAFEALSRTSGVKIEFRPDDPRWKLLLFNTRFNDVPLRVALDFFCAMTGELDWIRGDGTIVIAPGKRAARCVTQQLQDGQCSGRRILFRSARGLTGLVALPNWP